MRLRSHVLAPAKVARGDRGHNEQEHDDGRRFAPTRVDRLARMTREGPELVFLQVTPFGSFHRIRLYLDGVELFHRRMKVCFRADKVQENSFRW